MTDRSLTGRPLTADDLFQFAIVSDPQLSPDGARIAYVVTRLDREADDYRAAIWLVPTAGGDPVQISRGTARDTTPRWSPDGTRIAFGSNRAPDLPPHPAPSETTTEENDGSRAKESAGSEQKPINQIWTIALAGGEARQITRQRHGASDPAWSPDGQRIAFISATDPSDDLTHAWAAPVDDPVADERIITTIRYRADGRGFIANRFKHIWTVAADGGEARQLSGGHVDDGEIAWSPDSSRIAYVSNRTADQESNSISAIYIVAAQGGETRPLLEADGRFDAPAWSPDGTQLAVFGHTESETFGKNIGIWTIPATGGEPINHGEAADLSFTDACMSDLTGTFDHRPVWSPEGDALFALASAQGTTHIHRVDLGDSAVTPITTGSRRVSAFSLAADGRNLAFIAGDARHPNELFVASVTGRRERQLTDHNRSLLDEVALVAAEEVRFPSEAGDLELHGWILKPRGFRPDAGIKYPAILQIHGGPHGMYGHALFHEMQLMAARGYVVMFTNPRGSVGYGETFSTSTKGNWGESDAPDILGALDALLATGYVDERRVGITGGSYGGYLTNWMIGHTDRFAAAVTQRCVSNFYSMYGTSDIGFNFGQYEFGGTPWADADHLLRLSPISSVAAMTTPLLIIHNEGDLRCPIEQAEQLFTALKRLGREVSFVRIPEEDHNLSRTGKPSRRLARLHHLIGWFDSHL
ncbi:MAG: S9 family peptidase [Chloroflexota bacterium]|nr:S9 family peptidase [Chloroflexota bacterium]